MERTPAPSRHVPVMLIVRLALEPGVFARSAHSLSITDGQIGVWFCISNPFIGEPLTGCDEFGNPFILFSFLVVFQQKSDVKGGFCRSLGHFRPVAGQSRRVATDGRGIEWRVG